MKPRERIERASISCRVSPASSPNRRAVSIATAIVWINASLKERVTSLIEAFELLDAKEQKQREAGRKGAEFGHLGAEFGKLGGRPEKKD